MSSTGEAQGGNADGMIWISRRMALVDANDSGYCARACRNLDYDAALKVRGIIPGDTAMTIYDETDGGGGGGPRGPSRRAACS